MFKKIISLFLSLSLIITQPIFAQGVAQLNIAQYLGQTGLAATDSFRPTQLRYFSYDEIKNSFQILLDKGDAKDIKDNQLKQEAKELMDYFLIGLTLPNDAFWVNLRPDSQDNIIDPELEKTDLGRILLEADLQLKKDTAGLTSPQTSEGKAYWEKLYKKAGELFGTENIIIPTITRPWIVPGEIIVRESGNSAYIYKATLKVLLEQDHLKDSSVYNFSDPRLKELNEYSSQIIRETIIPKLTQEVNSNKRYAQLRQAYYSLVLSRWFKQKYSSLRSTRASEHQSASADYISLIDSGNLTNLIAKEPYDKLTYFKQYQESFANGEYNLKEPLYTPYGQSIRAYMSGGLGLGNEITKAISGANTKVVGSPVEQQLLNKGNAVFFDDKLEIVNISQPPIAIAASPIVNYKSDNPAESIIKAYNYIFKRDMINGYEYSIITESFNYNPMLAAYKLGLIIKNKLNTNQIKKDFIARYAGAYDYGFIHDAKELDKWLHWLTINDVSRIREIVNDVLDSISSMLSQGSSLNNSINNQRIDIDDIGNNYIGIIEVLNAAIDTLNMELPTTEINRGSSNDDLKAAELELRKLLAIVLTEAIISKIYDMPKFNDQISIETCLYINDFKSAINRMPRGLYMSKDEHSILTKALENILGQRKDYISINTAVVPVGKLLMLELEKSMGELAAGLQVVKDEFGLSHSEWVESAADLIFFPVYRKYRKKLLGALTAMQDRIEETKKSYNILISAGDNFGHSIDALMDSSEDLRDTLFQVRGYLNYIFSKRSRKFKESKLEVLRDNYELVGDHLFMSGKEILNEYFPDNYKSLYDAAYRAFFALEKYEDNRKVLKNAWENYKTDPATAASPVTVDEKFIDKFIDIVSPIYVSDDTDTEEISKAMKEISKEYRKMLRNRDVESFRSLLSYAQELLKHFLSHPFVEGGMDWDAIISKAVDNLKELSYSLEAKYKPDENTRQGTQKPKGSAASPVGEIKIEAKKAIENAGESLRKYMLSDEAQNKYNISAEYIEQLETIKLWLWLEGAVKFFNDRLSNPETATDAGRIVSSYKQLAEELKRHTTASQQLIKDIYATFKARTIKSADDAEAILRALLAMGKEEEISKEEFGITIEVLSPRQVDRVIPVWKIIETIKQAMAGEIQNRGISYMQKAILDILIDDKYPGCAFLRKERLDHFLRYAKTLVDKDYLDAETVSLIDTAIKEKTYGRALNIVMNLNKEKMGQASPEEVAEFNKKQRNVDIDNSIPTLSRIVEAYLNNKDSLLSKEEKAIAGNMYATSSAASPVTIEEMRALGLEAPEDFIKDNIEPLLKAWDISDAVNLNYILTMCKMYMLGFPGSYMEKAKIKDFNEIKEMINTMNTSYFNANFTERPENFAVAAGYLSKEMEDRFKESIIAAGFESLQKKIMWIIEESLKKEESSREGISAREQYLPDMSGKFSSCKDIMLKGFVKKGLTHDYLEKIFQENYKKNALDKSGFLWLKTSGVRVTNERPYSVVLERINNARMSVTHRIYVESEDPVTNVRYAIVIPVSEEKSIKVISYSPSNKQLEEQIENEFGELSPDVLEDFEGEVMAELKELASSAIKAGDDAILDHKTVASPVVLKYEVETIQGVREKLNEYHSRSIKDFSKVSLSDLIKSFNGTAEEIKEAKGSDSYGEQKEWLDIATELSEIQDKVKNNIETYRGKLVDFYANIRQNPGIKLSEDLESRYVGYAQTIKATNDPDEIIAAAEQAYKLVYGAASPLTVDKLRKDLASINSQLKRINKIVIELSRSHNSKMQNIANRLRLSMVKMNEMQKDAAFLNNNTLSKRDVLIWADRYFTLKDKIEFVEYYALELNKNKEMMDINEKLTILKNDITKVLKEVKALYYSYEHNNSLSGVIENKGGIDFTDQAMRIGLEPMGSFADLKLVLPEVSNAAAIDLDNEFKQIQLMASSGIRPSDTRILEFAAACYYRGEFGHRMGEITSCLQQAHFLDERLGRESSPALRLATILPEVM